MEPGEDVITAIAGVFSGRPNPEIVLRGADATELAERLRKSVGKEPSNPPPPPKLGFFYGFQVHAPKKPAKDIGLPENFNVFSGVITEQQGREPRHWRDSGGVEQYLIAKAYEQGHGELLEKVGATLPVATKH